MSILKKRVNPTAFLHFRDANGELMYAENAAGQSDESLPIGAEMYGPGSQQFIEIMDAMENEAVARFLPKNPAKSRGRETSSRDDPLIGRERKIATLTKLTAGFKNVGEIEVDGKLLEGKALAEAIWGDPHLGFLIAQGDKFLGDWANFTKPSATN